LAPCRAVDLQNAGQLLNVEIPCDKGEPPRWNPDGKQLASLLTDGRVQISNADGSEKPFFLEGNRTHIESAAWSHDGRQLAITTAENVVYVWSLDNPTTPRKLHEDTSGMSYDIAWSPDGTRIALVSHDETLRIVKVDGTDKPLVVDTRGARHFRWSPDGQRIFAISDAATIEVWDAQGRGDPLVLSDPNTLVTDAFWSPDGKRIVTISADRVARVWLVDIPLLQEALRHASTNCLTPEQRESLLVESAEAARKGYEACEKSYGRISH
jgi:WD40 repeat protein